MKLRKLFVCVLSVVVMAAVAVPAMAQDKKKKEAPPPPEQFVPVLTYKTGPFAAGGSGFAGGWEDYMALLNLRDKGINGVMLKWEECDFGYNTERGVECYERLKTKGAKGAPVIQPYSTGVTYALMERAHKDKIPLLTMGYGRTDATDGRVFPYAFPMITNYWNQSSAKLRYIAQLEGGEAKLKGMKIVNLHLKHPYGNETIPVWDKLAERFGFEVTHLAVPWPGIDQKSLWLRIRQIKPAYVINRNWGVSCTVPLREAARIGFPRDHIIGVWWCGSEEDVIPAGKAAKDYITANFHAVGRDIPVIQEIFEIVYGKMKGNISAARVGTVFYNRGVVAGVIVTEAMRLAHKKFGVGPIGGEEMQWGLENLELTPAYIASLGATGLVPPLKISCFDHEGGGSVRFQQWDGTKWKMITDWIPPYKKLVRGMIEASAAKYAKEKKITPRDCPAG
ncbi:MAG: ABC transporter substrate-binding protein [Rhodospirillales bacterium]|jgi:branched-chain amino acid transport system substrate-binding protein|nr:ABC transporter substrate-binding protein [Rhodospirillales bacterium]